MSPSITNFFLALIMFSLYACGAKKTNSNSPIPKDTQIFMLQTTNKASISLDFGEIPTMATHSASICGAQGSDIVEVKLWMPHHGHGSAPTTLTKSATDDLCTEVGDIQFIMTGLWELRVNYANGDQGVFSVEITR